MNKRREAFLLKKIPLKRFTKKSVVIEFAISEREFDKLILDGLIEECDIDICPNCWRDWNHEEEECLFCGEEYHEKLKGYYKYK